jgi:hypothetical protein
MGAAVLLAARAFAQEPAPVAAEAPDAAQGQAPAAAQGQAPAAAQGQARGAAQAPDAAAEAVEEVVVRGRRLSELEFDLRGYITEFVDQVAAPPPGRGYARWDRGVCVGVHNLDSNAAQYIVDRISLLAAEVGLEPGEPGCNPDVIVIFSTDAQQLASGLVESEPRLFRPAGGLAGMNLGLEALEAFAESERAVRWWHVSMPVDSRTGARAIRLPQDDSYPVIGVAGPSRIHSGIRDRMQRVIVIVDATRLSGTTWQELGDYLAVVSLAQIDPDADPSAFDSILNLFSNPAAYSGLTDWDRTYIRALYEYNQERIPQLQINDVVSRMAKREREAVE